MVRDIISPILEGMAIPPSFPFFLRHISSSFVFGGNWLQSAEYVPFLVDRRDFPLLSLASLVDED
jgi:hypothetical protein